MGASNVKAMREALEKIQELATSDRPADEVEIANICRAALSSPPRNCDRLSADQCKKMFEHEMGIYFPKEATDRDRDNARIVANGVIDALFDNLRSGKEKKMEANNIKAMREALEAWLKAYDDFVAKPRNGEWTQSPCGTVVIPPITAARLVEMTTSALAAPLRNCDVGTALDQSKRFMDFCRPGNRPPNCEKCEVYPRRMNKFWCQLEWAQMPYAPDTKKEIDEPKSKGDVNEKED